MARNKLVSLLPRPERSIFDRMGTGNKYERQRQANIEKNEAMLESLGLNDPVASGLVPPPRAKAPPKKRKTPEDGEIPMECRLRD